MSIQIFRDGTLKDNIFEKIILVMFILISIFLFSLSFVLGQVFIEPDSVSVPPSINENEMLDVSFYAFSDPDIGSNITYKIFYDSVLVSNTETFSELMNYSSAGMHTLILFASDDLSNTSENYSVEILDVPMSLTLTTPLFRTYNALSVPISVSVSTYADFCSYHINDSSTFVDGNLTGANPNFDGNFNALHDGLYSIIITCSNIYETAIVKSSFRIDTVNPVILSKSYSLDVHNVVAITAVTDTACTCRYDSSDKSYDTMTYALTTTNSINHFGTLSGLSEGTYTYYIRCKNVNNNIANAESVSFNIINKPTAVVSLSKDSPIKAGTYEVKLITSKSVVNAPLLYYNFNSDTTPKYITLTGYNTNWKGYLIIDENTPNLIGTFHYSATDYSGNIGNVITNGEIFLVDTTSPDSPTSIAINTQSDGRIKLKWYYDNEDVKRYNIYRSTSGDPDYVDYYDSTASKQFIDSDVIEGITYYYRVAVVDEADNDGILSGVVQATSTRTDNPIQDNVLDNVDVQQFLDYELVPKVNQLVTELTNYLLDIDNVKSELDKINDPNKLKIITVLKLSENAKTARIAITALINQANELKNTNMKVSDLDMTLSKLRMDAVKAKSLVAEDIIVSEQSSYDQITQESDVDDAISEVVQVNLSRTVLNNYSMINKQLQDNILIKTDIFIFRIKYLGKDDYDKYTLVKKVISSSDNLVNISIVELIPKSFEAKASDIMFDIDNQQLPVIVKEDPVLRWDVDTFNQKTIYYMINNNAEMSSAKNTKTLVLLRPDFKVTQTIQTADTKDTITNRLTGLVGLNNVDYFNFGSMSLIQWMIMLGLGLIIGLSTYYVALDKKEKKRNSQRLQEHRIISRQQIKPITAQARSAVTPDVSSAKLSLSSTAIVKPVNNTSFDMSANLDRANTLINNFDYENARAVYNACMKNYVQSTFKKISGKEELKSIKLMLNHLYTKLTVYRVIYLSKKHMTTKNYSLLKQDLDSINKSYTKLYFNLNNVDTDYKDAEKKFLDYVSNSKKHLEMVIS